MSIKTVFYILPDPDLKRRDLYLCRVTEKAYQEKHRIYIYTSSSEETKAIDDQLWTFRDISFLPHEIYQTNTNNSGVAILVGNEPAPANHNDILINMAISVPTFHSQFSHLIEVVAKEENLLLAARKRYQYYKQQNYLLESHQIE